MRDQFPVERLERSFQALRDIMVYIPRYSLARDEPKKAIAATSGAAPHIARMGIENAAQDAQRGRDFSSQSLQTRCCTCIVSWRSACIVLRKCVMSG